MKSSTIISNLPKGYKNITAQRFQKLILGWFDQHGRKHLPWQQDKTPYRVWVSEIMLQQTQVSTVIPYFERFMRELPDLFALAKADEDKVMHLWAGLGYYSRARNLHRAAKRVAQEFGGMFPDNVDELQSLPGIGQSTAGAIAAIAFNQPAPILDGNVKRVLARFHGVMDPINEKNIENKLWSFAKAYTPKKRVADYTQAMMDLGATICTRSKPQCNLCPLVQHCVAHLEGVAELLPRKKASREIPVREATFLILKNGSHLLLNKRPPMGIWGGLWCFPEIAGKPDKKKIIAFCRENLRMPAKDYQLMKSFRHTFTHYHLDIYPIMIEIDKKPARIMEAGQQIWYNPISPDTVGLPKPVQLIMRALI